LPHIQHKTGGLAQKPFLSAASGSLPLSELSSLHAKFGGDDSATRAETWQTHGTPEGICLCGGTQKNPDIQSKQIFFGNMKLFHRNGSFVKIPL